jgi:hypothetical protein
MTALRQPNFITIADYLAGEEVSVIKHEYLGGTVHAMAGATNRHHLISGNSFALLYGQLRGKPCQPFNSDTKVRIEFPDHLRSLLGICFLGEGRWKSRWPDRMAGKWGLAAAFRAGGGNGCP